MESMADVIKKNFPPNLQSRFSQLESDVYGHPSVLALKEKYPDRFIDSNKSFSLTELWHFMTDSDNCSNCTGLNTCKNMFKGHRMIVKEDTVLGPGFVYSPCEMQTGWELQLKIKKHIQSHHVPEHIMSMTFHDLEMDTRREVIKAAMRFCTTFEKGKTFKGLYLHGMMGFGKSAIAGAMTQELAKRGVDVIMVYVPDFLEELKDSIKSGGLNEKISAMKKVSVLILDDIGAEDLSSWTRDNVIGAILNDRMEKLPTVYTSNLSLSQLEEHLAKAKTKQGYETDRVKAKRIMERIEPFVSTFHVLSSNWRRKNA